MASLKILHVSDIHCCTTILEEILGRVVDAVDAITVSGDFECDEEVIEVLKSARKPVFAVTGNMDDHYIAKRLKEEGLSVEAEVVEYRGYLFAGISGREPLATMEKVRSELRSRSSRSIIIAHHPPHGLVDVAWSGVHAGLYEARRLVEELQPIAYLCGHIHEARGVAKHGRTLVVNPGPVSDGYYAIVVVEDDKATAELHRAF